MTDDQSASGNGRTDITLKDVDPSAILVVDSLIEEWENARRESEGAFDERVNNVRDFRNKLEEAYDGR